jgi:asparagine synthase (glutamine-hydrolysing)
VIFGIFDPLRPGALLLQSLLELETGCREPHAQQATRWAGEHVAMRLLDGIHPSDADSLSMWVSPDGSALVFSGRIYDSGPMGAGAAPSRATPSVSELLLRRYERGPDSFLDRVNGKFAIAIWDEPRQRLVLARDRAGIEPLYYSLQGDRLVFGSSLRAMLNAGLIPKRLNHQAVLQYLLYNYNPDVETFVSGARRVRAGQMVVAADPGVTTRQYWGLSFERVERKSFEQTKEEILPLIEDSIRIRVRGASEGATGVLLSGGTDSSTLVSLASKMVDGPLRTFSFRCEGFSYDESHWARLVADRFGTEHTEFSYRPGHLRLMADAVQAMEEPFCDAGIEVATFLLGRRARGNVSFVLSGEGGDELFAGHPAYSADKLAAYVDAFPDRLIRPVAAMLQRLPDSAEKKNLQVKLKRFAYGLEFPRELLSHRWSTYYLPDELGELCTLDFQAHADLAHVFDGMMAYSAETCGGDVLSRSLYSDFHTLVSFYLNRLRLLGASGVESRVPLLDHRLIEYAATIPSDLKLHGMSGTKYIYRQVLEGVLPREILHDRPKLGHSVPMKNWMRDDPQVKGWMLDILTSESFLDRGLCRPEVVRRYMDEHARRAHNHAHRLWGLAVLELWMSTVWDAVPEVSLTGGAQASWNAL